VDNELPPTEFRLLGRVMAATFSDEDAFMEVSTEPTRPVAPAPAPTAEYGAYLASGLCAYCHGEHLEGNETPPGPPGMLPAPPLAAVGQWTLDEFAQTLRTGVTPSGRELNPEFMPIEITKHYDDTDLAALHAYLGTLQAGVQTASGR
jgi:cytochrome c553